jgi:16S rRNA G966 N2-methylase RsmD
MPVQSNLSNTSSSLPQIKDIRNELLSSQNRVLSLDEILLVSRSYYGDEGLLSLFGKKPKSFYKMGIRILGRSAIECSIDAHSIGMAKSIKKLKRAFFPREEAVILDLFLGSGNLLYHAAKALGFPPAIGIENNREIYTHTKNNLKIMGDKCQVFFGNSLNYIKKMNFPDNKPLIVLIAPPWGQALSFEDGLDLLKTSPPVDEVIASVKHTFSKQRLIFVIQTYEKLVKNSVKCITDQFAFANEEIIPSISSGLNTGLLVCSNEKMYH